MTDHQTAAAAAPAEAVNGGPTFIPLADILETQDAVIMLLDMPGADPDSLNVTLERLVLAISARSKSTVPQGYTLLRAEYRDGNYERSFKLAEAVDGDRIEAVLKDGVLRLRLPKAAPSPVRKIDVKAA